MSSSSAHAGKSTVGPGAFLLSRDCASFSVPARPADKGSDWRSTLLLLTTTAHPTLYQHPGQANREGYGARMAFELERAQTLTGSVELANGAGARWVIGDTPSTDWRS
jgi:hypothetical protein